MWTEQNCEDWAEDRLGDGRLAVGSTDSDRRSAALDCILPEGEQVSGGDWRSDDIGRELNGELLRALTAKYPLLTGNTKLRLLLALLSVPASYRRRHFSELTALLHAAQHTSPSGSQLDLCFFAPLVSLHTDDNNNRHNNSDDGDDDDGEEEEEHSRTAWVCDFDIARLCSDEQLRDLLDALSLDDAPAACEPLVAGYVGKPRARPELSHTTHFQLKTPLKPGWMPPADIALSDDDDNNNSRTPSLPSGVEEPALLHADDDDEADSKDAFQPALRMEGSHSRRVARIKRVEIDEDPEQRNHSTKRSRHAQSHAVPPPAPSPASDQPPVEGTAPDSEAPPAEASEQPALPTLAARTAPVDTEDVAGLLSSVLGAGC